MLLVNVPDFALKLPDLQLPFLVKLLVPLYLLGFVQSLLWLSLLLIPGLV